MFSDIIIPKNNEDEFIELAARLGYKKLHFLYNFDDYYKGKIQKKLEKFLEITLIETDAEGAGTLPSTGANVAPTLGDLLSQNKKRK